MSFNTLKSIVIDNDRSLHDTYRKYFDMYLEYSLEKIYVSVQDALSDFDHQLPDIIFMELSLNGKRADTLQRPRFYKK